MRIAGFRKELRENRRDFPARLALIPIIYAIMLLSGARMEAHLWLAGTAATQLLILWGIRQLLDGGARGFRRRALAFQAFLLLANLILASGAPVLWFWGGEVGRMIAVFLLFGAMVHTGSCETLTRVTFNVALGPYLAAFVALPLAQWLLSGEARYLALELGAVVIAAHVAVAALRKMRMDDALMGALSTAQRERKAAIDASGAKTSFLATISHEIRTPMNAVVSGARFLEGGALDPTQRAHVARLRSAADVMTALLNDVLDFSRIEAGKVALSHSPQDLPALLGAVFDIWGQNAREKGLRFQVNLSPDLPRTVLADGLRLRQILINLLSNAVKFTEAGDIEINVDWRGGEMAIAVRDSGIGVAPERLERIFASFEQGGADISQRYGGAGLGLSISSELTRMMGGRLSAQSVQGRGSTFTLSLPVERVDAPEPVQAQEQRIDLRGMKVLAVDDSEPNREVIKALLEPQGVALELAEDGLEAVGKAESTCFDAILMDMRMPRMDGVEATRRLRMGGACRNAPIFAVTANVFDEHRKLWVEAGADEFVGKPIDFTLLLTLLDRYRARGRAA